MNMKRLLTLVAFFATVQASAQQVNPVPDYVFANRMSAGRNTVTDTAAYFSIGPRYGATRGMMPPMVVDTASFSANKRNGLLIFSVQKNKFLYWDSVGVKWAEMAGTAGTALTSADTAALLSTRAWRQKGIDSLAAIRIGGSGTTNYVPKFTAGSTIGNSQIFDNGTNVGIGSITPGHFLDIQKNQNAETIARIYNTSTGASGNSQIRLENSASRLDMAIRSTGAGTFGALDAGSSYIWYNGSTSLVIGATNSGGIIKFNTGGTTERMRIFSNGRVGINTTTDAGYLLDVKGNSRFDTSVIIGRSSVDNQVLLQFPTFDFVHRELKNTVDGFNTDSTGSEYILLRSIEGQARQTFLIGDASANDKNVFGFSNSTDFGSTYNVRFVINNDGGVGIGTNSPNSSALIDMSSSTRGFLPPRMTTTQRDAISSPAAGLVIYNTTTSKLQVYTTAWTDLH